MKIPRADFPAIALALLIVLALAYCGLTWLAQEAYGSHIVTCCRELF